MAFSLPAGWTVDEHVTVTAANQSQFFATLEDCPALRARAVKGFSSAGSEYVSEYAGQNYHPPVGWQVMLLSTPANDVDQAWIDLQGNGYRVSDCYLLAGARDTGEVSKIKYPVVLALVVGVVAWYLFSSK